MFIPYTDDKITKRAPIVNNTLILANVVIYLSINFRPDASEVLLRHAIHPDAVTAATLFSCMFLHGGFFHILGNMLFLHIYGDNVEDKMGHLGYLLFYLGAGLMASFFHISTSTTPALGASGALAGVMGAYVILYPKAKIKCLLALWIPLFWCPIIYWPLAIVLIKSMKKTIELYSWFVIGTWFVGEYFDATKDAATGVAHAAHIGGFVMGGVVTGLLILSKILKVGDERPRRPMSRSEVVTPELDLLGMRATAKEQGAPCPACVKTMRSEPVGGFEIEACYDCGGLWLDRGETENLLTRANLPYSLLNPAGCTDSALIPHGQRECPRCDSPLKPADIEGVNAEGCVGCGGLWLERGELGELRDRLQAT